MAVIKIEARKDARSTQTICLIQGDRRTQILRFNVNRYDGGVDLMDLSWVIKTRNAAGVEDVYEPAAVEIGMTTITIDWLVDGSVTNDSGMADYELNGLDTAEDGEAIVWKGGTGTISVRANIGPKFGDSDGMTNIEKLILYVEGELEGVVEAGNAAMDAAARANRAADNIEDVAGTIARADAAAQRATQAAEAVEDLEGAVNRANAAAASVNDAAANAAMAAGEAYSEANRAREAADAVENITEAVTAAHEAAETANNAAATANAAALPHVVLYGTRVHGETAKASGNPVTFLPDAGSLLQPVTVLEPKQAGSGDPYPAGGGKNLLPVTATTQTINGVTFTVDNGVITVNGTATATAYLQLADAFTLPAGTYVVSGIPGDIDYNTTGGFFDDNWNLNRYGATTLSEAKAVKPYIRINSGQTVTNVVFKLQIEAGSTPSDFMPYSNIRPITGYDTLDLNAAGKNLLPDIKTSFSATGITFAKNADGSWHISGTATAMTSIALLLNVDKVSFASGKYTVSLGTALPSGVSCRVEAYDKTTLKWFKTYGNIPAASGMYTIDILGDYYTTMLVAINSGAAVDFTIYPMIRLASIADATYASYQHKLYTIQIGQTVYGGKFDWLTGKLTAELGFVTLTGNEAYSFSGGSDLLLTLQDAPEPVPGGVEAWCSHYKRTESTTASGIADCEFSVSHKSISSTPRLCIKDSTRFADPSSGQAYITAQKAAGTPVQIAYKLATPVEIQLTPTIISAADPEQSNTLYGDGSIEAEYVKPLHVSIEERVAAAMAALATE